ncbi:MAG: cellulase family glycosylhydrolase [Oscillospiraceae bacterium]|nr:cellulase family glycosylhydrolase [Oscillospiraceae bacterium]
MKFHKLTAFLLCTSILCTGMTGCSGSQKNSGKQDAVQTTERSETIPETSADASADTLAEPLAETEPQTTEHISPREEIVVQSGVQKDYTDATLNHDTNKIYPVALSDFIRSGDIIQKFIFEFEADSNIGSYQGGCGISVNEKCKAATDDYWYQSQDFTVPADGNYVKVEWDVPAEIQEYISPKGKLQIGYWWGDVENIRLKYVTCCYTRTEQIPVDDTANLSIRQTMDYDTNKTLKVSLADVLEEGWIPQAVTFQVSAGQPFGKLNAGFRIRTGEDDWYESNTASVFTDSSQETLTWLIPDKIKTSIPHDTDLEFEYFWSEAQQITLDAITVKSSYGSGGHYSASLSDDEEIQVAYRNDDAQKIVKNIKVGWNLGNSLDCYDITWSVSDFETAWGNPKTTKQMIDTVKSAGFNAIRIPVSWTDHLDSDGNIDSLWLKRVQQVVDYAMDNHLYTILNMHHDDYTWLTPVYYKEEEVTQKYIKVWSQIADRFKNYDTKLLFEGLNEPRIIDSDDEWTGGTAEERDVINHLLQAFVDTVRNSGGKNSMRTLIITTQAASISETSLNGLVVPEDDNLILSIHNYAPWKFTSYDFSGEAEFTQADKEELNYEFDMLNSRFVSRGLPVIIGEFGAENKNNTEARAAYYEYYIKTAAEHGIPCFIWDNNTAEGEGSYGMLNRSDCSWYFPEIIEAVQNAIK